MPCTYWASGLKKNFWKFFKNSENVGIFSKIPEIGLEKSENWGKYHEKFSSENSGKLFAKLQRFRNFFGKR